MDTEQHPITAIAAAVPIATSAWTPMASSSPTQRADGRSATTGSSNSVGRSSLDTASASPHLEHHEASWSFEDASISRFRIHPAFNRMRAYTSNTERPNIEYARRLQSKKIRPLGGASRRRLLSQIEELTAGKAELQARLESMAILITEANKNLQSKKIDAGSVFSSVQEAKERDAAEGSGKRRSRENHGIDDIFDGTEDEMELRGSRHGLDGIDDEPRSSPARLE